MTIMNYKLILINIIILLKIAWIIDAGCAPSYKDSNKLNCYYSKDFNIEKNLESIYNETLQGNYSTLKISNFAELIPSNSSITAQHTTNELRHLHKLKHLIIYDSKPIIQIIWGNSAIDNSETVQPSIFNHLETLTLSRNQLESLPENFFANFNNLKEVDLSENQFKSIPDYMFSSKAHGNKPLESSIEKILLSENQIENITEHSFSFLANLKHLILNSNNIVNIAANSFSSLANLEELVLTVNSSSNKINEVDFSNLKQLKNLTLTQANESLFKSLQSEKLEKLDLSGHHLKKISLHLFDKFQNLRELSLGQGEISEIETGSFSHLKNLTKLYLYLNKITEIKAGTFDGASQLIVLDLSDNEIKDLTPESFDGLTNLQVLFLRGSQLSSIPKDLFRSMKKLKALILNSSKLKTLPDKVFESLGDSLEHLSLDGNELEYIPSSIFKPLQKLKSLSLTANKLKVLDEDSFNLPSLTKVYVSWNELTNLPPNLLRGEQCQVKYFFVNNNNLTSIEDGFFENVKLKKIDIGCNPLTNLDQIESILKLKDIKYSSLCWSSFGSG